jgi:hypothetical protein
MPAVIDPHELSDIEDIETHGLTIEQPQARASRPGFWRMMTHRIIGSLTLTPRAERTPAYCNELHRFETPMDRFVREHPFVALYAIAIF